MDGKQIALIAAIGAAAYLLIKKTGSTTATTNNKTPTLDIAGMLAGTNNKAPTPIASLTPSPAPAPVAQAPAVAAPAPAQAVASVFSSGPSGPAYTGSTTMSYEDVLRAAGGGITPAAAPSSEPISGGAKHIVFAIGGT